MGDLMTIPMSVSLAIRASGCPERVQAAVTNEQSKLGIILTATRSAHRAELEAVDAKAFLRGKEAGREETQGPPTWIIVGVTATLVVAGFFALKAGNTKLEQALK